MRAKTFLPVIFFSCILFLRSQSQSAFLSKLKENIENAANPTQKLDAVLKFCEQWDSYSPDTLKKYAGLAKQLATQQKNKKADVLADYYTAAWLLQVNKLDTALTLSTEVLNSYKKEFPYDEMVQKIYALRGNILLRTAKMDELMTQDYEWMQLAEKQKDTLSLARAMIGIGNANSRLKKYDVTLNWYRNALAIMQNRNIQRKLSFVFNNFAVVFYHLKNEDSAMFYVKKGIELSKEDGNQTNIANGLSIEAGLYAEYKHLAEAEATFKEEIEVRKQIGDVFYLIADMTQFALFYSHTKTPEKGIEICRQALDLAQKNGNDFQSLNDIYSSMADCYKAGKDYKGYSDALQKQLDLRDSIYAKSSAEAIAEIQTKYELQKKENTIIQQRFALSKKNFFIWGSLGLLMIAVVSAVIIFRQYKKRQNLKLKMMQEQEKHLAEKRIVLAEEAERKRIAADLHDNLGAYAASIASNLDHLHLGNLEDSNKIALQELRHNSQSIVRQLSDTIWAMKKDSLSLTAISDRIKIFIQRIQPSYPDIKFDVVETIGTDHLLPPSQAFHIYQIVQEAINNALRHSHCKKIKVDIHSNHQWNIKVFDDGTGMNGNNAAMMGGGNGVTNMKGRAEQAGWKIEWVKNEPTGTCVAIGPTTN